MSKSLRCQRAAVPGRGNGRDLQSGSVVAADWLAALDSGAAAAGADGEGDASQVLQQFLPPSRCDVCDAALCAPFRTCGACTLAKKREYDAGRYRQGLTTRRRRA